MVTVWVALPGIGITIFGVFVANCTPYVLTLSERLSATGGATPVEPPANVGRMRFMCAYQAGPAMRKLPLVPGASGHRPLIRLRSVTVFGTHVSLPVPDALPMNHELPVMPSLSPITLVSVSMPTEVA